MRLHLRPVPRNDTYATVKRIMTERLRNELAEEKMDSRMPRHFNERQFYLQHGEKP